jgi:hypothetical protein
MWYQTFSTNGIATDEAGASWSSTSVPPSSKWEKATTSLVPVEDVRAKPPLAAVLDVAMTHQLIWVG